MSLLDKRAHYKPFQYPWAFRAFEEQSKMHWIPGEVSLSEDIDDWKCKLTDQEKELLTQLFRFFTQADVDVAGGYIDKFLPTFKPPEVRMMLTTFAGMEAIHIAAYSLLLDTIGMPEIEYAAFQEYEEMKDKHEYLNNVQVSSKESIAHALAVYSAFGEGLQLFSSFAILLNFPRFNKMKGMGQIVTYSIKDESLHVEYMLKLFHTFLDEHPKIWKDSLKARIYQSCRDMVILEDRFIDLAFGVTSVEGLAVDEVKRYIRYVADRRLCQLGLKPEYGQDTNPLPWLDWMVNGVEHSNFFETKATAYSKCSLTGSWQDVWGS